MTAPSPMLTSPTKRIVALPDFDDLSPDLRYQLVRRCQRRDWSIMSLASMVTLAMLAIVAVPALNALVEQALTGLLRGSTVQDRISDRWSDTLPPEFATPIQQGDIIASYRVTSGYGLRDTTTLPAGASSDHRGVDVATPTGTRLFAPGDANSKVKVHCWRDPNGGGLVADIESATFPALRFQALHLADCTTGMVAGGQVFAATGDSGIGAEHLDWRQRDRNTGSHQHPHKHFLLWALTGKPPIAALSEIDTLRTAIIGQESAGDPRIVNPDSGALGLGQVMPENLAPMDKHGREIPKSGWDYDALGRDLTPQEFLADTNKQIKVINYQLGKLHQQQLAAGYSKDEAIKRTAAAWYSGDPNLANHPTPQYWEGDSEKEYPSIAAYSEAVLQRVRKLDNQK